MVVIYILLSAAYILYSQFALYQGRVAQQAFLDGRRAAVEELIEEAERDCQPFPVFVDDKQIELINVACLIPAEGAEPGDTMPLELEGE
ncbi:MAG: hypothetical protein ACK2UK_04590 [Candidatus Promineifilaceae bacterium]